MGISGIKSQKTNETSLIRNIYLFWFPPILLRIHRHDHVKRTFVRSLAIQLLKIKAESSVLRIRPWFEFTEPERNMYVKKAYNKGNRLVWVFFSPNLFLDPTKC